MATKKAPLLPPSAETREALLQIIRSSQEPLAAKALATLLADAHTVSEAQLTPLLEELATTGVLQKYSAAKGKPRYWDRDLRTLARASILQAIQAASAPLTAKELVGKILPLKVSEVEATEILQAEVAGKSLLIFPPAKATGKPLYWDRDLRTLGRTAVLEAAQQADEPFTAKDLTGRLKAPLKLAEADVAAVLDESVAAGTLHPIPGTTAKSKPRFWTHDVLELGCRATLRAINTKGPQTLANLKKEMKGLNDKQIQHVISSLQAKSEIAVHPPLGSTKHEVYGTRPPAPAPYLKDVGTQLNKVVTLLKSARVPVEELRRVLVQLLEEAGISFGGNSTPANSPPAVDLVSLIKRIEPGAERGALVGARDLRRVAQLAKPDFDHAVLELARQGQLSLHRHDYATSLSQVERDELVTDGDGTFYVGMALRSR